MPKHTLVQVTSINFADREKNFPASQCPELDITDSALTPGVLDEVSEKYAGSTDWTSMVFTVVKKSTN